MLINLFENFEKKYLNNKDLLKDLKYKTIKAFMNNFFEDYLDEKIETIIKNDNKDNIILSFLESNIQTNNVNTENQGPADDTELMKFDNHDKIFSTFSLQNLNEKVILKIIFFQRIISLNLKINSINNVVHERTKQIDFKSQMIEYCRLFLVNFFKEFSSQFYFLLNIKLFKFIFNKTMSILLEIEENQNFLVAFFEDFYNNSNFREAQKNLFTLLYLNFTSKHNITIPLKESDDEDKYHDFDKKFQNLIQFIFEGFKNIRSILNTQSESTINKIHNEIITIFKNFWTHLNRKTNIKACESNGIKIENYLNKTLDSKIHLIKENYEVYIFIYDFYFKSLISNNETIKVNSDKTLESKGENIKKIILLKSILENNTPALHRFSLSFLKDVSIKLKADKIKNFLDKFIILYDVLDGFNSHLFKQLVNELIFIIEYCEKDTSDFNYYEEIDLFAPLNIKNETNILDIFRAPINYFYILANKIFSHENSRIQKFFIKTFSQLSKDKTLKNKNFENFLFKIFMKSINNPLFYPENENIGYHSKLGLVIENLFSSWFINILKSDSKLRFLRNFERFLYGLNNYIELRRVLSYLINIIKNIFYENFYLKSKNKYENIYDIKESAQFSFDLKKLKDLNKNENHKLPFRLILETFLGIIANLNCVIYKHFKYLSIYNKNNSWENLCLIFFEINLFPFSDSDLAELEDLEYKTLIRNKMEIEFYKFLEFFLDYYALRENTLSTLISSDKDSIMNFNNKKYMVKTFDKRMIMKNFLNFSVSQLNSNLNNLKITNEFLQNHINKHRNISADVLDKFMSQFSKKYNLNLNFSLLEKVSLVLIILNENKENKLFEFDFDNLFEEFCEKIIFSSYVTEKEKSFLTKLYINYLDLLSINTYKKSLKGDFCLKNVKAIFTNLNYLNSACIKNLKGYESENAEESYEIDSQITNFNLNAFVCNTENLFLNTNSIENKYILNNPVILEKIIFKSFDLIFSEASSSNITRLLNDMNNVLHYYVLSVISSTNLRKSFFIEHDFSIKHPDEINKILNSLLINFEYMTNFASLMETSYFLFWKKNLELSKTSDLKEFLNSVASNQNHENLLRKLSDKLGLFYDIIEDFLIKNERQLLSDKSNNLNKEPYYGDYSGKNNNIDKTVLNINIFTNIRSNIIKIKYFSLSTLNVTDSLRKSFVDIKDKNDSFIFSIIKQIFFLSFNEKELNIERTENQDKTQQIILKQYSDNLSLDYLINKSKKSNENKNDQDLKDVSINNKIKIDFASNMFYLENLLEYLEKCSEESISYIFDLISYAINFILDHSLSESLYEDCLNSYLSNLKKVGLNLIIDKRENLDYINVKSYIKIFMKKKLLEFEEFKSNILTYLIYTITDLNEKRTWLLIKVFIEELLNLISNEGLSLASLKGLESNIIDLAEAKETRGDDSFMLKVVPNFLYSPFNLKNIFNKFAEYNNLNTEDISKYGIYVRWSISKLFENLISSLTVDLNSINSENAQKLLEDVEFILGLINKILSIIDKNSSAKSEMQFTTKHRKKLRLSQFLVIASKIFLTIKTDFSTINWEQMMDSLNVFGDKRSTCLGLRDLCKETIQNIEKINFKLFEKINLYSVKFYIDLFSLNLCYSSNNFFDYLIKTLQNPQSKTHCVSSSMIILSMFFLQSLKAENSTDIANKDFKQFFEILISLCTSNVCNIRGFAQYFVYKFSQKFNEYKGRETPLQGLNADLPSFGFSQIFINYLNNNSNIQKFFKKFDESFVKFTDIYDNYTFENVVSKNFDEINCEIIPIDILNEFKELGMKMIKLENEDFTKPNISWKWGLCPELMESVLQTEKLGSKKTKKLNLECNENIKEILSNENKQLKSQPKNNQIDFIANQEELKKEENTQLDFQKKYRPGENNLELDSLKAKDIQDLEDAEEKLLKKEKKRKRLDIVVMASLIDKAPNLGGLARTCEVFNLGCMTICSEAVLNDNAFLTAAASAEKWLPLVNLPSCDIEIFLISYKKLGYKIIGLEQTANSITLRDFKFTEKIVIVLGNEKEGIPQNIINLIDYCVIIPQFGEIRSLNVHVSAALMLWEIVNAVN